MGPINRMVFALVAEQPTTAIDVADSLRMDKQLASAHLAHLARRGAIERCGQVPSPQRGRPVTLYRIPKRGSTV